MLTNQALITKKPSHSILVPTIDDIYSQYLTMKAKIDNFDQQNAYNLGIMLLKLMGLCYNSKENQIYLCRVLNLPYKQGAITLNSIPKNMKGDELFKLFQHIKSVKQNYFCWIVYFNQQLQLWNVKFIQQFEISQNLDFFNPLQNLLGIFIGRYKQRGPELKPKIKNKAISKKNLDELKQGKIKNKSLSMKEPKFKKMSTKLGLSNSTTNSTIYNKKIEEKISKTHSNILVKTENNQIKINKINVDEYELAQQFAQEKKLVKQSQYKLKHLYRTYSKAKQVPIQNKQQKLSYFKKKSVVYPQISVKQKLLKKLEQTTKKLK